MSTSNVPHGHPRRWVVVVSMTIDPLVGSAIAKRGRWLFYEFGAPSRTLQQRFTALQSGEIDVLSRNTTWTLTRDASLGMHFVGVTFYDGQGFMVPKKLSAEAEAHLRAFAAAGHEVASHGWRWIDYRAVPEHVERAERHDGPDVRRAVRRRRRVARRAAAMTRCGDVGARRAKRGRSC